MIIIRQATAFESPDATLGGVAVTTPSVTGHASTTSSASGGATTSKSCRWHAFQSLPPVAITSMTLKLTHTSSGTIVGAGGNFFSLQYSLNGGGAWNTAVSRTDYTASQGPTTFSVALSVSQDISQVQIRDFMQAEGNGDSATATATVSSIGIEVVMADPQTGGMM